MIPIPYELGDINIVNYIHEEIVNTCPSNKYGDGDIQFVKSGDGANTNRMLPLTASIYIYTIKNDNINLSNMCLQKLWLLRYQQ